MFKSFVCLVCLLPLACAEKSFQGGVAAKSSDSIPLEKEKAVLKEKVSPVDSVPPVATTTESVSTRRKKTVLLKSEKRPLDIVWIVDNSGSMSEEAAQVRKNFKNFTESLGSQVDMKLALISKAGNSGTNFSLSPDILAQGHLQIASEVGSTNTLAIAAAASCPLQDTQIEEPDSRKVCGVANLNGMENAAQITAVRGKLMDFFRPSTQRVYVVVTDDNASPVDDKNFLSYVDKDRNQNISVFAFSGFKSGPNCGISKRGLSFEALAKQTGGEVFDICDTDWSPNFSKLSSQIVRKVGATLILETKNSYIIISATLDGVLLRPDQYRVVDGIFAVKPEFILPTSNELTIVYEGT